MHLKNNYQIPKLGEVHQEWPSRRIIQSRLSPKYPLQQMHKALILESLLVHQELITVYKFSKHFFISLLKLHLHMILEREDSCKVASHEKVPDQKCSQAWKKHAPALEFIWEWTEIECEASSLQSSGVAHDSLASGCVHSISVRRMLKVRTHYSYSGVESPGKLGHSKLKQQPKCFSKRHSFMPGLPSLLKE